MRVILEKRWTEYLARLPESGMGYQRVDIRLADDRVVRDVPVFNAEVAELPDDVGTMPIRDVTIRSAE